jgi:hypothetical protein
MLIISFDIKGTIHFEFIPQGKTANQAYYVDTLKRLREAVRTKRSELWSNEWIPQHDNAQAHKELSSSSGPKIDYRNGTHPIPLIWLRMNSGSSPPPKSLP